MLVRSVALIWYVRAVGPPAPTVRVVVGTSGGASASRVNWARIGRDRGADRDEQAAPADDRRDRDAGRARQVARRHAHRGQGRHRGHGHERGAGRPWEPRLTAHGPGVVGGADEAADGVGAAFEATVGVRRALVDVDADAAGPGRVAGRAPTGAAGRAEIGAGQIDQRLRRASFESDRTLEDFDFLFNPAAPRTKIIDLATCGFVERHENVLLTGPTGTGKSHIAQALGHRACRAGYVAPYVAVQELLKQLRAARRRQQRSAPAPLHDP